jgi:hypothetical protein
MKLLALPGKVFSHFNNAQNVQNAQESAPLAIAEKTQEKASRASFPISHSKTHDNQENAHSELASLSKALSEKQLWQETKRIKRLRLAALEGATANVQIEGLKINGLFARAFLNLYDSLDKNQQKMLEEEPISKVFILVNNLINKGIVKF